MDKSIQERLTVIIHEVTGNDTLDVQAESRLEEDLGMDSVDFASLLMAIEEDFDGSVEDSELVNIKTVSDVVELIQNNFSA